MKAVVLAYNDIGVTGLEALRRAGIEIAAVEEHPIDAVQTAGIDINRPLPLHSKRIRQTFNPNAT